MDRPTNLMVIVARCSWNRCRTGTTSTLMQDRVVERYPVFSQRPARPLVPLGPAPWEDDPDFDLHRHLHRVPSPSPGDDATLQRFVEERIPVPSIAATRCGRPGSSTGTGRGPWCSAGSTTRSPTGSP